MSQENVKAVRHVFAHWATGDFFAPEAIEFDPHVIYVISPSLPESGVYVGQEGLADFMVRFLAHWENWTIEAEDIRVAGDTVLVQALQRGTGKASGVPGEVRSFMLFTFRAGRVVRMDHMLEKAEALEAAGLSD